MCIRDSLNEHLLGFTSYYTFRNRYANMLDRNFGGRRVQIVGGYKRLDELAEILKAFSYRVLKEHCLDLPEKIYIERQVELTEEQSKAYSTMKSAALATLKGKMATAPHVLTQMMRLHQITCGHLKNDDGTITEIKNNRLDELLDVLDEIEGKAIIWANYIYDIEHIVKEVKKEYGENSVVQYYGAISSEKRLQSEDRAHRIGQKKAVTYVDLIAPKTVDEKIRKALRKKINIATEVMGEDLREWI